MEKERGSKIIVIIALCVGVVGLSLGFAAFSSQLTIRPNASVSPDADTFKVQFTSVENSTTGPTTVTGSVTGGAVAGNASIGSEKTGEGENQKDVSVIGGLNASFTAPGQKVTYEFFAYNSGEYEAFLNSAVFSNALTSNGEDSGSFKYCEAGRGTDVVKVAAACNDIKLTVTIGEDDAATTSIDEKVVLTGGQAVIDSQSLASKTSEKVVVEIEYTAAPGGNTLADGDFSVYFGDITLEYGSVD